MIQLKKFSLGICLFSSYAYSGKSLNLQSSPSGQIQYKSQYNPYLFQLITNYNIAFDIENYNKSEKLKLEKFTDVDQKLIYPSYIDKLFKEGILDLTNPNIKQKIEEDLNYIFEICVKDKSYRDIAVGISSLYYTYCFTKGSVESQTIFYEIIESLYKIFPHAPIDYFYSPYILKLLNNKEYSDLDSFLELLSQVDPKNKTIAQTYRSLGIEHILEKKCLEYFKKASLIKSDVEDLFHLGMHYLSLKNYAEALQTFNTFLTVLPNHPECTVNKQLVYDCQSLSEKGLKEDPEMNSFHNQVKDTFEKAINSHQRNNTEDKISLDSIKTTEKSQPNNKEKEKSITIENLIIGQSYDTFCKFFDFSNPKITPKEFLSLMKQLNQECIVLKHVSHIKCTFNFQKQKISAPIKKIEITSTKQLGEADIKRIRETFIHFDLYPHSSINELKSKKLL